MVAEARKRNRSLDVIRSLAIVSVVCEHVSSDVLSGMPQLIGNVFGTLGVPLFVMLTGYLMVDRKYDAAYTKKIPREEPADIVCSCGAVEHHLERV